MTIPVDALRPQNLTGQAAKLTPSALYDKVAMGGADGFDAMPATKENANDFYFPDSVF